ncbi:unnamed protein product, partial [Polarella glacialis]
MGAGRSVEASPAAEESGTGASEQTDGTPSGGEAAALGTPEDGGLKGGNTLNSVGSTCGATCEDSPDSTNASCCEDDWCFIESSVVEESQGRCADGPLDEGAFPRFAPFLAASQAYASLSGCRFKSDSFCCLSEPALLNALEPKEASGNPEQQAARRAAEPAVRAFAERLRKSEAPLLEELTRALDMVMFESVRNAMIAAFREVDLWPPSPRPDGVGPEDFDYEDLTAAIPVIAQRTWNEEAKRRQDAAEGGGGGAGHLFKRAVTASFLVDFAHEVGAPMPPAPESHLVVLREFSVCMDAWIRVQSEEAWATAQSTEGDAGDSDDFRAGEDPVIGAEPSTE